jgi:hypothetical protein
MFLRITRNYRVPNFVPTLELYSVLPGVNSLGEFAS